MRNLTFKSAMLKGSQPTVNRQSTDGQSQRHYKQTPLTKRWKVLMTLVFLFTFAIGNVWGESATITIGSSTSTSYAATFTSSSTSTHVTANATSFTKGNGVSTSNSTYGKATAPYSVKYKPSSNLNTNTYSDANSISAQFTVASGYTFAPSAISATIVTEAANYTYQAVLTDGTTTYTSSDVSSSADGKSTFSFTSLSGKALSGTVTFKIWYKSTASNKKFFVVNLPITITGTVAASGGGGDDPDPGCTTPTNATITANPANAEYTAGDNISLTASAENATSATFTWYKGTDWATASAGSSVGTGATFSKNSCTTDDEGTYWCNISNGTGCEVQVSKAITVAADTKCFNMPEITSKPSDLAHVTVTGGTLSDVSVNGKAIAFKNTGLGLGGGNDARLKVTLTGASIVEGTKITINYNEASTDGNGSGLAIYDGDHNNKTLNSTGLKNSGSVSHTFTAEEAANYDDEFIIDRNQTGKGIIMGSITVEDCGPAVTKHTITLNYNDGVTPNGSIKVVDGKTAAAKKPTDPTRGKYTFLGWFVGDTDNEYVWSTAVTGDITLKAHWQDPWTITFDEDGGSEVADITVKHNTKAEKPADPTKENHDFNGWYYGNPEVAFNWDANVTQDYSLKAHWLELVAKYDIEYYDGETKIGTEAQVRVDQHPTAAGISTDKPLYSFVGWYTSSTLEGDPVALNAVTPSEGLKLYGKWNKAYAADIDFEAFIDANGTSGDWGAELADKHYAISSTTGVTLDAPNGKPADKGLKIKNSGSYLSFNVHAGKLVLLKAGVLSGAEASVDGGAHYTTLTGATGSTAASVVTPLYNAAEAEYRIRTTTGSYNIIQSITIQDPYQVTFDANGGEDVASLNGTPSVTLPSATKGTDSFLGWFDGDTKVGEAGESYTPTADITLKAHWEAVSTDARLASITFSATGTLSPAFDPEVVNYTYTMPYKTAAVPTITSATSVNANAQTPIIGDAATAWGGSQTIKGVAQSGDKKTYTITMQVAPKDGISLIKVATTGGTNKTVTGVYAGDGDVNLSSNKKMDKGKYIGFTLNGTALQAGDKINVHTTQASSAGNSHIIFYDNMTDKNELYDTEAIGGVGDNIFTINADMVGKTTAYVYRASDNAPTNWNGFVDYIEATRVVMPTLTAIKIDGRNGEIDALDDKHFNVTIPYASVLTSLTVVPTIVRNAAHATTPEAVISNEGAWVLGDNTYRVMDKDGDYTDYTITLTRDVLKHTVSFNAHGGTSVASVEVVHNEYLAAAPTAPEKEDYIFQYWSLTDGGAEVNVTSIAIDKDTTFHAVWASDGGIKLIVDGTSGKEVNTTNYITGVAASKVTIGTTEYDCVTFEGTVGSSVAASNMKHLDRHVTYNATTTQTKVKLHLYNNSDNQRTIYVQGVIEGNTSTGDIVNLLTLQLNGKEEKTTDYIEFNNAKNRSIYVFVSSDAGDIKILQEKVIESGEPLKKAGDSGYSLNMNKGRMFGAQGATIAFEGMTYTLNGDYAPVSSTVLKVKSNNIVFVAAAPTLMKVTTANDKTYYVTKDVAGTDNETAKTGVSEFDLTAGTWYITAGGSEVQFTKIEFVAPKCAEPAFNSLTNSDICQGDSYVALNGTATVADAGTPIYQWYNADGDVVIEGATDAEYTPTADGSYYVIATNQLAGYTDNVKKSATVTVTTYASAAITTAPENQRKPAGQNATLTVAASGKAPLTYQWYTCDENGDNAVIIAGAEAESYQVAVTASMHQYYKVVVSSGCGSAEAVALVEEWSEVERANVTGSRTWDWSTAGMGEITLENGSEEYLMANVSSAVPNTEAFRSDMLLLTGTHANRGSSNKFFQGWQIRFYTEVPGKVSLNCRAIHETMSVTINGTEVEASKGSDMSTPTTPFFVPAGWVTIVFDNISTGEYADEAARLQKIVFNAAPDYTRDQMLGNGVYGTLCVDHNVPLAGVRGATFYELMGREPQYGKLAFDEIVSGELVAGKPYVFQAHGDVFTLFYGAKKVDDPVNGGGMYGTFEQTVLSGDELDGVYYFAQKALWSCEGAEDLTIAANRAYVKLGEINYLDANQQNPAPGRRRVTMAVNGEKIATGMENINASEQPVKRIINGQLFILRGEKMYDATGRLVK